ncbi:hypothetical protein P8452_55873 [Trifolium repens]|nr:hypothetical protein P8452_55873 [Trifolium repens]
MLMIQELHEAGGTEFYFPSSRIDRIPECFGFGVMIAYPRSSNNSCGHPHRSHVQSCSRAFASIAGTFASRENSRSCPKTGHAFSLQAEKLSLDAKMTDVSPALL